MAHRLHLSFVRLDSPAHLDPNAEAKVVTLVLAGAVPWGVLEGLREGKSAGTQASCHGTQP